MNQTSREPAFRKTNRNFSDLQTNFLRIRSRNEESEDLKGYRPKANSIKINRNKLPPDFFPRSESLRKKISSSKQEPIEMRNKLYGHHQKAETERNNHRSPQKTSFFGFFEQNIIDPKNHAYTASLKRKFESREEPKRAKIIVEHRNFTPSNGIQRAQILGLIPMRHDVVLEETMVSNKKGKSNQISPRKEHMMKYHQSKQAVQLDPEKEDIKREDMHNITFFNVKSTSFPPINKNKSSS